MKQQGVMPDVATYNTLLSICALSKQPERASQLFEEMLKEGVVPDLKTYNLLMIAYGSVKNADQALKVFKMMELQGVVPDFTTYSTLLSSCTKNKESQPILQKDLYNGQCREILEVVQLRAPSVHTPISSSILSIPALVLTSLCACSAVFFTLLRFQRRTLNAGEEPLLTP